VLAILAILAILAMLARDRACCGWLCSSLLLGCAPRLGRCQVGTGKQIRHNAPAQQILVLVGE
jgi:hypothetical protein